MQRGAGLCSRQLSRDPSMEARLSREALLSPGARVARAPSPTESSELAKGGHSCHRPRRLSTPPLPHGLLARCTVRPVCPVYLLFGSLPVLGSLCTCPEPAGVQQLWAVCFPSGTQCSRGPASRDARDLLRVPASRCDSSKPILSAPASSPRGPPA